MPSPKFHEYVYGAVPPETEPANVAVEPALAVMLLPALTVREPFEADTVIDPLAVPVLPYSSLAVTVTLYVPADENVWQGFAPVPVVPSPKFHEYVKPAACTAGLTSVALAVKLCAVPTSAVVGPVIAGRRRHVVDRHADRARAGQLVGVGDRQRRRVAAGVRIGMRGVQAAAGAACRRRSSSYT